jgi:hypothetical protein
VQRVSRVVPAGGKVERSSTFAQDDLAAQPFAAGSASGKGCLTKDALPRWCFALLLPYYYYRTLGALLT